MTEQNDDQAESKAQEEVREIHAWLVRQIENLEDWQELDAWTAAFIAGEATLESYPIEAWQRVYFPIPARTGQGQVIITSTGNTSNFAKRLYEEAARQTEAGQLHVPHYRWEAGEGTEPPQLDSQDL